MTDINKIPEDWCVRQEPIGSYYLAPGGIGITRIHNTTYNPKAAFVVSVIGSGVEKTFANEADVMKFVTDVQQVKP